MNIATPLAKPFSRFISTVDLHKVSLSQFPRLQCFSGSGRPIPMSLHLLQLTQYLQVHSLIRVTTERQFQ